MLLTFRSYSLYVLLNHSAPVLIYLLRNVKVYSNHIPTQVVHSLCIEMCGGTGPGILSRASGNDKHNNATPYTRVKNIYPMKKKKYHLKSHHNNHHRQKPSTSPSAARIYCEIVRRMANKRKLLQPGVLSCTRHI